MYGTHTVAVSFAMLDIMRNGAAWGYDLDPRTSHLWDRGTWGDARFLFWWFGWVAIEFNLTYVYSFLDTVMMYIYIDILYQGIATHANISMYTSYVCKYIYLIRMYTYTLVLCDIDGWICFGRAIFGGKYVFRFGHFFDFWFPASLLFYFCFSLLLCLYSSLLLCFSAVLPICPSAFLLFPAFLLFCFS